MTYVRVNYTDGSHEDVNLEYNDINVSTNGTLEIEASFTETYIPHGKWTSLEVLND